MFVKGAGGDGDKGKFCHLPPLFHLLLSLRLHRWTWGRRDPDKTRAQGAEGRGLGVPIEGVKVLLRDGTGCAFVFFSLREEVMLQSAGDNSKVSK